VLGLLHPYYVSALAPAVAVLAAGGLVALWDRSRGSGWAAAALAAALVATGALSLVLLDRTPDFVPWLRWVVLVLALAAATAVLLVRLAVKSSRARTLMAIGAGLAALLAGPAAYSIATVGRSLGGGDPTAGPATSSRQGPPGAFGRARALAGPPGATAGLPAAPPGRGSPGPGGPGGSAKADKQLVAYLKAHRGGAKYLVAATGSMTAAPIILATHQPVITMGGFMGGDPSPSVSQLKSLIHSGQLRYVLLGGGPGGGPGGGRPGGPSVGGPPAGGPPAGGPPAGGPGGRGAGPPGGARAAGARARETWVTSHCSAVSLSASSVATSARSSGGQGLYDCAAT
jgi:4-amino-4-deoxy-L-arabinose transferase-like glycosyltransferase